MGAKTGQQYMNGLKEAKNTVYIHGERVDEVTEQPAFKGVVQSMAKLYDIQHEKPEKMLYTSPTTGDPVSKTFMVPKTVDDLIARREAIMEWQQYTGGLMCRSPDYLNADVMAMGRSEE